MTAIITDRAIFKQKRAEQTFAAESILKLGDYSKQYQMVEIVLEKLFKVSIKLFDLIIIKLKCTMRFALKTRGKYYDSICDLWFEF